jgi:hypothetical protein
MNDVIICHGSNLNRIQSAPPPPATRRETALTKINEAMTYSPSVASSDKTMFLKIGFTKTSETVSGLPVTPAMFCIPFTAKNMAENCCDRSALKRSRTRRTTHSHVNRDNSKPNDSRRVPPFAALRSVAQRQYEAHDEETEVDVIQDGVRDIDPLEIESGIFQRLGEDDECNVVVSLQMSQ